MKKNLLYLFLLIGLATNAKHLTDSDSDFVSKPKKDNNISLVNTCQLNVTIGSTLDMPTSVFFVAEEALNGTAPYIYLLDGNPSPNGKTFYASTLNPGNHTVTVQDANGCTGSGTFVSDAKLPTISATSKNPSCIELGSITLTASGGVNPYFYSIDGGIHFSLGGTFTNLNAGHYDSQVKDSNGNISSTTIILTEATPITSTITKSDINCKGDNVGIISIIATGGTVPYMFSIDNGVTFQSNPEFNNLSAGTYNVIVKGTNECIYTETIIIREPASALSATVSTENQTITVTATGGTGTVKYAISPNLHQFFTSNTFTNLTPGVYELIAQDQNGCYIFLHPIVNPSVPLLNGEKVLAIQFTPGQTLRDIIVDGQNIKWYSSAGTSANKSKAPEATLPLSTELVDNTTYYASQTINGFESTQRLAVTTKLSLSTADYSLPNFKFYPNPVKNILTISNTSTINEVVFTTVKGETILTKQINSADAAIDLSAFSKGLYFLQIKAEGTEKTIKIIKE